MDTLTIVACVAIVLLCLALIRDKPVVALATAVLGALVAVLMEVVLRRDDVTSVVIDQPSFSVPAGGSTQLSARALNSRGKEAWGKALTWKTGQPGVVTVNASGLVTAVGTGRARVAAIAGPGVYAVVEGQVVAAPRVVVRPGQFSLAVGESRQLRAVLRDRRGREVRARELTWASSSLGVLEVSDDGIVTGVGPGEAVVSAMTPGSVEGVASATVIGANDPPRDSLPPPVASLPAGTLITGSPRELVCTHTHRRGSWFPAIVVEEVRSSAGVVIPSGTPVEVQVTSARAGRSENDYPLMRLALNKVVVDGRATHISASSDDLRLRPSDVRQATDLPAILEDGWRRTVSDVLRKNRAKQAGQAVREQSSLTRYEGCLDSQFALRLELPATIGGR